MHSYPDQLCSVADEATRLVENLTDAQFNWKPAPDRWSIAECLDHLNVVGSLLLPKLQEAIRIGDQKNVTGNPPFRYGPFSRLFIRMNSPSGIKLKTVKLYKPSGSSSLEKTDVMERFLALQDELAEAAIRADGLDLAKIKVSSPAGRLLRISLGAWFEATVAHERRHLIQAREVKRHHLDVQSEITDL